MHEVNIISICTFHVHIFCFYICEPEMEVDVENEIEEGNGIIAQSSKYDLLFVFG